MIIKEENFNKVKLMKWGLIPHWVKNLDEFKPFINIRSDSLLTKPNFYNFLINRRCIVPSNGFYEWKKVKKTKIPYFISIENNRLFSFAGIYDIYKNNEREILSFAIITTEPNEKIKQIHERMPVILDREGEKAWLDTGYENHKNLIKFFKPFPEDLMNIFEISNLVNNPENNFEELILPYKKEKGELF